MNKNLFFDFLEHMRPSKGEMIVLGTAALISLFGMIWEYIKVM
jgi:hypothetical protein